MAIDIRASVSCSLGEDLISATINDDYVQGNGLVKVSGSAEIVGVVAPAPGTPVTFTYTTPAGVTRTVPRNLLVLSSFANPYTKTTKVELGCALTYLQDLREEINWAALDDPENAALTCEDQRIVTLPIYASSIFNQCLSKLGLSATQNPLTNKFSIAEFDFSAGYVQIISDLLVSENYCGFINAAGQLEVFSLDQTGGSGPVIDQTRIIELGPVGVGGVPAETVVVNYSTLKLQLPDGGQVGPDGLTEDEQKQKLWELQLVRETPQSVLLRFANGSYSTWTYTPYTRTRTLYITIGGQDYVAFEETYANAIYASHAAGYIQELSSVGVSSPVAPGETVASVTKKFVQYLGKDGYVMLPDDANPYGTTDSTNACVLPDQLNETKNAREIVTTITTTEEYEPEIKVLSSVNLPMVFSGTDYVVVGADRLLARRTVETSTRLGDYERVTSQEYCRWYLSLVGQQAIAIAGQYINSAAEVTTFLSGANAQLVHNRTVTQQRQVVSKVTPGRPAPADLNAAAYATGDPNNGYRTENKAEIELAMGSPTALRRLELSLPYAPDDVFIKTGTTFTATASDAEAKARAYGRVQNALLMGNRSGISIQTAADLLPPKPFSPLVISAQGVSGLFRTNGTGWVMDGNGIVMSTDALFMGGAGASVGATGDTFFPTSPTVTTLPTAPAVVDTTPDQLLAPIATVGATPQTTLDAAYPGAVTGDGVQALDTDEFWVLQSNGTWLNAGTNPGPTMTVTTTVPLWNETVNAIARTRTALQVTSFNYALQLLTEAPVTTKTKLVAARVLKVLVPATDLAVAVAVPIVSTGIAVRPSASSVVVAAAAPTVTTGASVKPAATDVALAAVAPDVRTGASVAVPAVDISVTAVAPVSVGMPPALVGVPASDIAIAAVAPVVVSGTSVAVPAKDIAVAAVVPTVLSADPNFSNVSLLLHMDGSNGSTTFTDKSLNTLPVTVTGNAQVSTAQSQFGGASLLLDGSGDYLSLADNAALELGSSNYTIEMWIRTTQSRQYATLIARGNSNFTSGSWTLLINNNSATAGDVAVYSAAYSGVSPLLLTTGVNVRDGAWHHIAWVRSGTSHYLYVDGTQRASRTSTSFTVPDMTVTTYIGYDGNFTPRDFDGYIDELRISKVARYTSSFTPTTVAFPDT